MTLQNDAIFNQTNTDRAILDPTASRHTRLTRFVSLPATESAAIADARAGLPSTIAVAGVTLPLANVVLRRTTGTKGWVTGFYGFVRSGGSAAADPFAFADIDVSFIDLTWWSGPEPFMADDDYEPYPQGQVNFEFNPLLRKSFAKPWLWRVQIWDIWIRVTLAAGVIGALEDVSDTLNANNFTIADKTFLPYQLHFVGPKQRSTLVEGTTGIHDVTYHFRYRGDGWYRQKLEDDDVLPVRELIAHEKTWATEDFPIA